MVEMGESHLTLKPCGFNTSANGKPRFPDPFLVRLLEVESDKNWSFSMVEMAGVEPASRKRIQYALQV